jgi:transposase
MFYGIDLGKESFIVAALGIKDEQPTTWHVALNSPEWERFKDKLTKEDFIAVEASSNTFWLVDQIKDRVKESFVINTWKFTTIHETKKKTDRIDAVKIVKRLKYYILFDKSPDELPLVFMPCFEVQKMRSLFSTYNLLKKEKNMTKNRIRSLFTQNGIPGLGKYDISKEEVQTEILVRLKDDSSLIFQVEQFFELLNFQEGKINIIKNEILKKGMIFKTAIERLVTIPGISIFIAIAIMTDVVDVNRFPNAKKFCAYLRTAPTVDSSGDSTKIGKINKQSRTLTMGLLVECINHFRNSSEKLNEFYIKKSKGKSKGKVRVAVVRKILTAIYYMLKRGVDYYYLNEKNFENKTKELQRILKKAS